MISISNSFVHGLSILPGYFSSIDENHINMMKGAMNMMWNVINIMEDVKNMMQNGVTTMF